LVLTKTNIYSMHLPDIYYLFDNKKTSCPNVITIYLFFVKYSLKKK
jgi:hypothetical protein